MMPPGKSRHQYLSVLLVQSQSLVEARTPDEEITILFWKAVRGVAGKHHTQCIIIFLRQVITRLAVLGETERCLVVDEGDRW